jgi:hypothetical protein
MNMYSSGLTFLLGLPDSAIAVAKSVLDDFELERNSVKRSE